MRGGRVAIGGGVVLLLVAGVTVVWQASRALRESSEKSASSRRIEFESRLFEPDTTGAFELIPSSSGDVDGVFFQGRLYTAGAGGLTAYEAGGGVAARYRPGFELPGAPVTALAVATLAGGAEPELVLATNGAGLLRFDGRRFVHVLPKAQELAKITALAALSTGQVLAGTAARGLISYDGERLTWFHESLKNVPVSALLSAEPELWVATPDRGVLRWSGGRLDRFGETEGLPDAHVLSLASKGSEVYAGTAAGVARFSGGRFERTLAEGVFAQSLAVAGGALLVGTLDEGVFEVGKRAMTAPAGNLKDVRRMFERNGTLYAIASGGAHMAEHGAWRALAEKGGAALRDGNISALALDSAGRLWVGYFDRGLDVLDASGARVAQFENEPLFCVNRIVPEQRTGNTLVATANGLAVLDAALRVRQVLTRQEGLIATHATDVALRDGGMVVATPAGITFIGKDGARSLYAFHGLVNNHVYALGVDGNRLLAGTLGGLSVLDGDVVRANFTSANSRLRHNWITAVARDGDGWLIGTYGDSIWRLDGSGRWQNFAELPKDLVVNPNAMAVSGARVYAGLLGGGLAVFDKAGGRWSLHTRGLPSLNVTAVAERGGVLYIGTGNGLVKAREEALRVP